MTKPKDGLPVLIGPTQLNRGYGGKMVERIAVWCPYCQEQHEHTLPDNLTWMGAAHMSARCQDGPLKETGYYVRRQPKYLFKGFEGYGSE